MASEGSAAAVSLVPSGQGSFAAKPAPASAGSSAVADLTEEGRTETVVTTVRVGGEGSGQSSAAMAAASCLERRKNLGRTSARFSGVSTFESEAMEVMQMRPSRRGAGCRLGSPAVKEGA